MRSSLGKGLFLLLAVGLFVVLVGWLTPARSGSSGAVTIRFWNGFTGPDGRTMLRMIRRFNAENPDIQVVMQRMDWGTYYNKLFVAGLGGRSPEVYVVHTDVLPRFERANLARPVDDLVARSEGGLDTADFDPNVWQAVQFSGVPVAVPLDVHPLGLYYNRQLFRDAGIVDEHGEARPPTNRAEFLDALKKLKRDGQWGYVFTWFRTNTYAMMNQFGGKALSPDGQRCTLDAPENVEALAFCRGLIDEGLVPDPQNIDAWIGFRQGKVGMVFEGIYMLPDLQRQANMDFAGAPVPCLGREQATWGSSHNLCIRAGVSGRELEASWRLIRFLSDNSLDWAEGGQVPVRRSLRETTRFQSMTVQHNFAAQIPYLRYLPRVPFIFEFNTEFDTAIEKALRGTRSPQDALRAARERIDVIMERDREMMKEAGGAP